MQDLGKSAFEELQSEEKRTVTLEIIIQALSTKKFSFLHSNNWYQLIEIEDYNKLLNEIEAEDRANRKYDKIRKAKKKEENSSEEETNNGDSEEKKKGRGGKGKQRN